MLDFAAWCDTKVLYRELRRVNLLALEDYRKNWRDAPVTRRKRLERLRSFFNYCLSHGWIEKNVAAHLSKIKVTESPTLPLTREQFDTEVKAVNRYNPKAPDCLSRRHRALAMLLPLRWSGLRINDAAKLERTHREWQIVFVHAETGSLVYVPCRLTS